MKLRHAVLFASTTLGAVFAPAGVAVAQSTAPVIFNAVSAYNSSYWQDGVSFTVTGVQKDAAGTATLTFATLSTSTNQYVWQTCEKQLLVMMNRPGRFSLTIAGNNPVQSCTLTQIP